MQAVQPFPSFAFAPACLTIGAGAHDLPRDIVPATTR